MTDKTTPTVERIVINAMHELEMQIPVMLPQPYASLGQKFWNAEHIIKALRESIASVLDEKVTDEQLVEILADKAGHSKEFVTANLKAVEELRASEISIFASQALAALRALRDRCARPEWVKEPIKLYAFMYNHMVEESSAATESIHFSKENAEKAMEEHKAEQQAEWNRRYADKGEEEPYPFGYFEAWFVDEITVLP